jgi:uncharacterized membrane protein YqiK
MELTLRVTLMLFFGAGILIFLASGLALIKDSQVGILVKKMFGKKMKEGQIISREGEIGIQAQILMPGLYWRIPVMWKIHKVPVTVINPGEIGCVKSVDGYPINPGRLLGDEVECNSFQDAKLFLENGGKRGPQVGILLPGTYRINTEVFTIAKKPAVAISNEKVGVVVALDGNTLPPGFIIAPKTSENATKEYPKSRPHNFFQKGQAFLDSSGYRGPQLDTLQPGEYYINPLLFNVEERNITDVPPGYVVVVRSNVGSELEKSDVLPVETIPSFDLKQPIHESGEVVLVTDRNLRGIWREPIAPGRYNINPYAFTRYFVPTSAVTIDWASRSEIRDDPSKWNGPTVAMDEIGKKPLARQKELIEKDRATEFFKFSQLKVTSKDGFQLEVDVRMVIRIRPENASFVIARFGSVANLIEQIVHPLIDSSFRNKAGEKKAIDFVQSRTILQQEALERARQEFGQYHVEAQNLLIAYIDVDKSLLDTQTKKEIAVQQQQQYQQEAAAEQERIQVQERRARADKQADVVAAKLSINIATDKAEAVRKEAEGIRDATKTKADGSAYEQREVGKGTADAFKFQSDVIGPERLALLRVLEQVAGGNVKITPDVLVSGSDSQSGNLFSAWMATMMRPDKTTKKQSEEKATIKES